MSIGLIVVLVLVIALILGPVIMMRPNPVQKNKERMRSLAREKGVHFSVRNIPQQADESEKPAAIPVYFFPPVTAPSPSGWMLVRANYEHEINFLGWWRWQGEARASSVEQAVLAEQLQSLPQSVRAVSAGSEGICVYWQEKGGDLELQQIIYLLESLKSSTLNLK